MSVVIVWSVWPCTTFRGNAISRKEYKNFSFDTKTKTSVPRVTVRHHSACRVKNPFGVTRQALWCRIVTLGTVFQSASHTQVCRNMRIFNGCEMQTENSIPSVTVSAIRGLPKDAEHYPRNRCFTLHRTPLIDSFSCILFDMIQL